MVEEIVEWEERFEASPVALRALRGLSDRGEWGLGCSAARAESCVLRRMVISESRQAEIG